MLILVGSLESHRLELSLFLILGNECRAFAVKLTLEVEDDVLSFLQVEADDSATRHLLVHVGRNIECQVIDDITDVGFTVIHKLFGNTS